MSERCSKLATGGLQSAPMISRFIGRSEIRLSGLRPGCEVFISGGAASFIRKIRLIPSRTIANTTAMKATTPSHHLVWFQGNRKGFQAEAIMRVCPDGCFMLNSSRSPSPDCVDDQFHMSDLLSERYRYSAANLAAGLMIK